MDSDLFKHDFLNIGLFYDPAIGIYAFGLVEEKRWASRN